MKIYTFDKYYPIVYPSNAGTSLQLYNKKLELLDDERKVIREIKRITKALHDLEHELYIRKNKEVIVNRQVSNPIFDAYV